MSADLLESRRVRYEDWMGDISSDNENEKDQKDVFDRSEYEGKEGHLLLQLQKTYQGDDRFHLNKDFDIDLKRKKDLPQSMLGAMSKRETELLAEQPKKVSYTALSASNLLVLQKSKYVSKEDLEDSLIAEGGEDKWDPEIDIESERSKLLNILGQIVP